MIANREKIFEEFYAVLKRKDCHLVDILIFKTAQEMQCVMDYVNTPDDPNKKGILTWQLSPNGCQTFREWMDKRKNLETS